ncbi:MAG: saccharopine dehydrogenase family protein [Vitreimonas sp.]
MSAARGRVAAVYGASGHTGKFVVRELARRGLGVVLVGRDPGRLRAIEAAQEHEVRVAAIDAPAALDRALAGVDIVINCAGPFLDTAPALIEAALRSRASYVDTTAEQGAARAAFEQYDAAAREAGVVVLPAAAFFGALGDLLATAALSAWASAEAIEIAIALDSWQPTLGTRRTGERNTARRLVVTGGKLDFLPAHLPEQDWDFAEPFGRQAVMALPFSETILMAQHLKAEEIRCFINTKPIAELRDARTPSPAPSDASGRSAQVFLMEARVHRGGEARRAIATGRDIYAISAPIAVEAVERILDGRVSSAGALAAGAAFDARDFLAALGREHLSVEYAEARV